MSLSDQIRKIFEKISSALFLFGTGSLKSRKTPIYRICIKSDAIFQWVCASRHTHTAEQLTSARIASNRMLFFSGFVHRATPTPLSSLPECMPAVLITRLSKPAKIPCPLFS
jgi:hypothetical protein